MTSPILSYGSSLSLNGSGSVTFNSVAGNTLGAFTGSGAININNGTAIFTGSNSNYAGNIALNPGTVLQVFSNNTSPLGTGNLALNGGTLTAMNASGSNPITNNFTVAANTIVNGGFNLSLIGAGTLNAGTALNINNGVDTTTSTTLGGTVIGSGNINVNNGMLVLAGNNKGFSNATSLADTLTVNSGAELSVTNNGGLGNSSIVVNGGTFNLNNVTITTANPVTLNNANLLTLGTDSFNGHITLANNSVNTITLGYTQLTPTVIGFSSVFTLLANIDGNGLATPGTLTINDGNTQGGSTSFWNFYGSIGTTFPTGTVHSNAPSNYLGTDVITEGSQVYTQAGNLLQDTKFIANNGDVTIQGALNGGAPLTISATGDVYIDAALGGITPIESLNVTSGGNIYINGNITTLGNQIFNGHVILSPSATLSTVNIGTAVTMTQPTAPTTTTTSTVTSSVVSGSDVNLTTNSTIDNPISSSTNTLTIAPAVEDANLPAITAAIINNMTVVNTPPPPPPSLRKLANLVHQR